MLVSIPAIRSSHALPGRYRPCLLEVAANGILSTKPAPMKLFGDHCIRNPSRPPQKHAIPWIVPIPQLRVLFVVHTQVEHNTRSPGSRCATTVTSLNPAVLCSPGVIRIGASMHHRRRCDGCATPASTRLSRASSTRRHEWSIDRALKRAERRVRPSRAALS